LLDSLKKALAERALNAEMDYHIGDASQAENGRNGYGRKTIVTDTGKIEIEVPRDRQASFDPQPIAQYQRRFSGFDDKIVSMYARGMSTREIAGHLRDLYGIDVSPDLISTVTDAVLEEVAAWQARLLDPAYPLVFFDAIRVKIRDEGLRNKVIRIALGVRTDGGKVVLGLWIEQNEGAKFWLRIMNELKNRGVEDITLAVVDGLKGFPEAITAVFPEAVVQTCIVHLLRNSTDFVSWKDRKALAGELKTSIGQLMPPQPSRHWRPSRPANGAGAIPPSARAGAGYGRRSSHSSPSQTRSAGSSIPRMPSRRSTRSCAGRSGPEGTSPATVPPPSCSI
jgi:transposase-like protein